MLLKKIHDMTSVFLNLLRLVLLPTVCSIMKNVPCELESNVYSAIFGGNILNISVTFSYFSLKIMFISLYPLCDFCFRPIVVNDIHRFYRSFKKCSIVTKLFFVILIIITFPYVYPRACDFLFPQFYEHQEICDVIMLPWNVICKYMCNIICSLSILAN